MENGLKWLAVATIASPCYRSGSVSQEDRSFVSCTCAWISLFGNMCKHSTRAIDALSMRKYL